MIGKILAAAAFVALAAQAGAAAGDDSPRDRAWSALKTSDADARRAAVQTLGEVGGAPDTPLLLALRDGDEFVRTAAEQSLWRIWSRYGVAPVDAMFREGMNQVQEGNRARAIGIFSGIIAEHPDFAEAWYRRGNLYTMTGDFKNAQRDLDEALRLNPKHFGVLEGYAHLYIQLAKPERALEYFQRAYDINPNLTAVQRAIDELGKILDRIRDRQI